MRQKFSIFFEFFDFNKKGILGSVVLSVLQSLSLLPLGFIIQFLFDRAFVNADIKILFQGILAASALILSNGLLNLWNKNISLGLIKSYIYTMREKIANKILYLSTDFYIAEDLDKMHVQIVQDTERLDHMIASFLTQFLPGMFVVLSLSCLLLFMNPMLFFILVLIVPVIYFVGKTLNNKLKNSIKDFHQDFANFSAGAIFILKFYELIKISSSERLEFDRQKQILEKLRDSSKKVAWNASAYHTIQSNLFMVGAIGVMLVGGIQIVQGQETPGTLISFYVILNLTSTHLRTVLSFIPIFVEGSHSILSLNQILQNENGELIPNKELLIENKIQFIEIGFSYPQKEVFKNFNCQILKNQITGISGSSGSGKSTLVKLLLGIYPIHHGLILIDGKHTSTSDLLAYRKKMGVLPQEPMFFQGTIKDNLAYGLKNVDEDALRNVCQKCLIHDFILSLPMGYQTEMGSSGNALSGGQKQRIAIARALIRDPEILILDEPDKNLDEDQVGEIIGFLKKMQVTTIIISHNRRVLSHSDVVYQLTG